MLTVIAKLKSVRDSKKSHHHHHHITHKVTLSTKFHFRLSFVLHNAVLGIFIANVTVSNVSGNTQIDEFSSR